MRNLRFIILSEVINVMFNLDLWFASLVTQYGFLGVFFLSLIGHATIFLPVPTYLIVYTLGSHMDPLLLGLFAGTGAAIGELTSYALGHGVSKGAKLGKKLHGYDESKILFERYGFWVIPFFAATPLPTDAIGIVAGVLRYPLSKFFLGCLIGKIIMHLVLAYGGFYSFTIVKQVFGEKGSTVAGIVFLILIVLLFLAWWKFGKSFKINMKKFSRKR